MASRLIHHFRPTKELFCLIYRAPGASQNNIMPSKATAGEDSTNSNKPPSRNGLGKKPKLAGSLRGQPTRKVADRLAKKATRYAGRKHPISLIKKHAAEKCANVSRSWTRRWCLSAQRRCATIECQSKLRDYTMLWILNVLMKNRPIG